MSGWGVDIDQRAVAKLPEDEQRAVGSLLREVQDAGSTEAVKVIDRWLSSRDPAERHAAQFVKLQTSKEPSERFGVHLVATDAVRVGGVQVAGGKASAVTVQGAQIAAGIAEAYDMTGVQLGLLSTRARKAVGAQLALIANQAKRMDGVQVSLFPAATDLRGLQLGAYSMPPDLAAAFIPKGQSRGTGKVTGAQLDVLFAGAQHILGLQVATGVAVAVKLEGTQVAYLATAAEEANGVQLALAGITIAAGKKEATGGIKGLQYATIANFATNVTGTQVSPGANFSGSTSGVQAAGFMNWSHETIRGAQAAVLANISVGKLVGFQVGLMNWATPQKDTSCLSDLTGGFFPVLNLCLERAEGPTEPGIPGGTP